MKNNWKLGLGFSLITAIMWGLLPIALKGVLGQMDSYTITWYRFSASALIALVWYGHRSGPAFKKLLSKEYLPLTLLTVIGLLVNYLFYLLGLNFIPAGAAQIVIQLAPLLLLLGSVIIFKESLCWQQWLGVAVLSIGMLLFFHQQLSNFNNIDSQYFIGIAMVAIGAVAWACYGLAQKKLLKSESSQHILLLVYIAGTLCFFPFAKPSQIIELNNLELGLLAFASVNTIIAYGCFGQAMTHWESSRVSAAITVAPLFTLVFIEVLNLWYPQFLVPQPLDWLNWLGGLLVVLGSIAAALARPRKPI